MTLELTYNPLDRLEEDGMITQCELTTYEPDPLMELAFDDAGKVQKVIMKARFHPPEPRSMMILIRQCSQSEWLRDAFAEIDPSSEKLSIAFSPPEQAPARFNRFATDQVPEVNGGNPTFRLEAHGILGSTEVWTVL